MERIFFLSYELGSHLLRCNANSAGQARLAVHVRWCLGRPSQRGNLDYVQLVRGEYFAIIPIFWLRNSFGFLALFGKVFGRGDIVSLKKRLFQNLNRYKTKF